MTKVMNLRMRLTKNQKGMTLIELLAVVVILGILAAVAGVAVLGGFDNAKKNADATNVQIITDAVVRYVMDGNPVGDVTSPASPTADSWYKESTKTGIAAKLIEKGYLTTVPLPKASGAFYVITWSAATSTTPSVPTVTVQ